ncbi:MAG: hypothetical protein IPJ89_01040 [Candidatus Iainarchaeum archaeon]|uniref:Uncharacterized protein n=1 Tax=Candidatus Iainarchaeum sp. TaxID=3101447 RepID=A0A7T9I2I7_9ARCH|nr:MAG: hypothetical protein IPJ89_01040 [Candidatus Diapherotrites archaeon]
MAAEGKLKLYRVLLDKYGELINQQEQRTVGQIKALVDTEDLNIQNLITLYKPEPYAYEKDYLETVQKIYEFLTKEIQYVPNDLNLNFWLSPKEILINKISDDEDLSVLLCTCMSALGDNNAFVYVMELEDGSTHAVVLSTINNVTLLLDPCLQHGFFKYYGEKGYVFKKYQFNGKKITRAVYRFNAQIYEQFV